MKNMDSEKMKLNSHLSIGNAAKGHHYWIGKANNGIEYFAGQTFTTQKKGRLKNIALYPEMIIGKTDATLSFFELDAGTQAWKEKKAEQTILLDNKAEKSWINFPLENILLDEKKKYGFKISCNSGGMMAIAECGWQLPNPYPGGEEWIGSSEEPAGKFHSRFGIAFIADIVYN